MEDTRTARRFRRLAFLTAGAIYALILVGGVVRIMGAGMACGDDWPLCDGRWIPPFELAIWLEWGHRLGGAVVTSLVAGLAVYGVRQRRDPVLSAGRAWVHSLVAVPLLLAQVILGAVVVKLELPTEPVVLHLTLASILIAIILVAGLQARPGGASAATRAADGAVAWRGGDAARHATRAWLAATVGFVLVVLGGLVANTGAAPLCQGFPLCNGRLVPQGGVFVQLHWIHRLIAYAFLAYLGWAAIATLRAGAPPAIARAALAALALALAQVAVAAAMVLGGLPTALRAAHLGLGVALWAALVVWAGLARPAADHRAAPAGATGAVPASGLARERPS